MSALSSRRAFALLGCQVWLLACGGAKIGSKDSSCPPARVAVEEVGRPSASAEPPADPASVWIHHSGPFVYREFSRERPGVQLAVLEGDPSTREIYTLRLKLPPGFRLPWHTHPMPERVTVLSGEVRVDYDYPGFPESQLFAEGAYYVNPPAVPHQVVSEMGAVLQVTGHGPFRVDLVQASVGGSVGASSAAAE